VALTDTTGTIQTTSYTYEPFGNSTASGLASTNSYQFIGRENDGTGLDYYRARYYNPTFQRFASEDQMGFAAGDPNLYAYAGSAPTDVRDPSGNFIQAVAAGCGTEVRVWKPSRIGRDHFLRRCIAVLAPRDFWKRVGGRGSGLVLVILLESWKDIGDRVGIDGVQLAEQTFASLCQFATRTATEQSRLSVSVFAAFWTDPGPEETAVVVLERWLPLQVSSREVSFSISGSWTAHPLVGIDNAGKLFERVRGALEARIGQLPDYLRFRPLTSSLDDLD